MATDHPSQQSLFGGETPDPNPSDLVEIRAKRAPLSKQQQSFNRLSADLDRQRRTLARWQEFLPTLFVRIDKELLGLALDLRSSKRELVISLDRLLRERNRARGVPKRFRARVEALAADIAHDLLVEAEDDDPEMHRIYKKLTGSTLEDQEHAFEELFSAVAEDLGIDVDIDDLENFFDPAGSGAGAKKRQRSRKVAEADAKARLSVRQIHRSLAAKLHPDREMDAAERDRKTRLMQRANDAYGANDIRQLLALQIEIEGLESADLADMEDERIAQFNQALRHQIRTLKQEIDELREPLRAYLPGWENLTPQNVDKSLRGEIERMRKDLRDVRRHAGLLRTAKGRLKFFESIPDPDDEPLFPFDF